MTSPSTVTDAFERAYAGACGRAEEVCDTAGARVVDAVWRSGTVHADFFTEAAMQVLADARVRVRQSRPAPATYRVREALSTGFSVRAFGGGTHGLVWSPDPSEQQARAAAAELLNRRSARPESTFAEPLDPVYLPERAHRVASEPWGTFLLERVVDAVLSADHRVAEIRLQRLHLARATCLATRGRDDLRQQRALSSLRIEVVLAQGAAETRGVSVTTEPPVDLETAAREAVTAASERLVAHPIDLADPPMVVAGGWGGAWLHEAVGHALEADVDGADLGFMPGLQVGPAWLAVIDDPTLSGGRATYVADDEGVEAVPTPLIEGGVVRGSLTTRYLAHERGLPPTPNGRRGAYRHLPAPRMSNLVMRKGVAETEDLLAEAGSGVCVLSFRTGRLDPRRNAMRLEAERAFRIRGGRLAEPVLPFAIETSPRALLRSLRAVGKDEAMDPARGVCKKGGQSLPVSILAPAVLFSGVPVTAAEERPA